MDFLFVLCKYQNFGNFEIHGGSWRSACHLAEAGICAVGAFTKFANCSNKLQNSLISKITAAAGIWSSLGWCLGGYLGGVLVGAGICAVGAIRTRAASWRLKFEKKNEKS